MSESRALPRRAARGAYYSLSLAEFLEAGLDQRRVDQLIERHVGGDVTAVAIDLRREVEHLPIDAAVDAPDAKRRELLQDLGHRGNIIRLHPLFHHLGRRRGLIDDVPDAADAFADEDVQRLTFLGIAQRRDAGRKED